MSYGQPSSPVKLVNTTAAAIPTNSFAVVDNHVGLCTKTAQLTRWVQPGTAAATEIQVGETFEMDITGIHEAACSGALTNVSVGDKLWIDPKTQAVITAPGEGGSGAADEVQTVKVQATGGFIKLTVLGETVKVKFNATHQEVQEALEATAAINPGDVVVSAGPGDEAGTTPYIFTFGGRFADTDVAAITKDDTELTGGEHKSTVTTTTGGAEGADTVLALGVIDMIDPTRSPHVARVNLDAIKAFLTA
jgi:hypothetical protein